MLFKKLKKIKFNSFKGFIGSIGDDLPSLVPLFFALMIFFAALAFAFTTINNRNATINTYIDSLTIARSALGSGAYYNLTDFLNSQKQIVTMSNYFYGLIYLSPSESTTNNFEDVFSNEELKSVFIQECSDNAIYLPTDSSSGIKISKDGVKKPGQPCDDGNAFFVASSSVSEAIDSGNLQSLLQDIKHKKYFYYLYPVTLLTPNGYLVVYLMVMVW